MLVRFWGTRGSIATPGPATVRYGGNTSCVEVTTSRGTCLVLDCGTGARPLGADLVARAGGRPTSGALLLGHTHWDHIQGLPFFAPLFGAGRWDVHGPRGTNESLHQTLAGQMRYPYFPVSMEQLGSRMSYVELVEGTFEIDDVVVRTQFLNHPALTLAYRLECDGVSVCYVADHEPFDPALGAGGDVTASADDARHVAFLEGADVVIHDAQYTADEYTNRVRWGHSSIEYAIDVGCAAGAARTVLFHHDPSHDDATMDALAATASRRAAGRTVVEAAAEGAAIHVTPRRRPVTSDGRATAARADLRAPATVAPAIDGLHAATLVVTGDEALRSVATEAALAERLVVLGGERVAGTEDARRVIVVTDVDDGRDRLEDALGALPVASRHDVGVLAVTRHPGATDATTPGVVDWLVWPASIAHVRTKLRAALLRRACRWLAAPLPPDEDARLAALHATGLLDTPADERYDRFTRTACERFGVPAALITLVDRDRQWFKSRIGFDDAESARDQSFCAHVILGADPVQVPDASLDPRFADNPAVTGAAGVRFYAGAPLVTSGGHRIGTLCIADRRPRLLTADQLDVLRGLADELGALIRDDAPGGRRRSAVTATTSRPAR